MDSGAEAQIVITEIMYNLQGADRDDGMFDKEWVKNFNCGSESVNLGGWSIEDIEDYQVTAPFPSGTMLSPNEALVLTGDSATFEGNWGTGLNRLRVSSFPGLSNTPSATNDTIGIRDHLGCLVDRVNYDDQGLWPTEDGSDGVSIFLAPGALTTQANQGVGQSKYDDHTAVQLTHAYTYHIETRYDWDRNLDSDPAYDGNDFLHWQLGLSGNLLRDDNLADWENHFSWSTHQSNFSTALPLPEPQEMSSWVLALPCSTFQFNHYRSLASTHD